MDEFYHSIHQNLIEEFQIRKKVKIIIIKAIPAILRLFFISNLNSFIRRYDKHIEGAPISPIKRKKL